MEEYNEDTFGGRLRKSRIEKGISIQELASMIEVTKSIVSGYEVGRYIPSVDKMNIISKYFDMNYLCIDGYSFILWNNKYFINNLKTWIETNNYSTYEASKLLGVSSGIFKYWFSGSVMSISTYNKIKDNLLMYKLI